MGRVVIVCYRPKAGQADALVELMRTHVSILRDEHLVTARAPITMQASDGTVVEVFEWVSAEAIASAHGNPRVQAMWGRFAGVCDYVPIAEVPEAAKLFSDFSPLAL